jgi:hypothetical protein
MALPTSISGLNAPIDTLGFSKDFIEECRYRNFRCLGDILAIGSNALIKDPTISLAWFSELTAFLRTNLLLHLLESKAK